MSLPYVSFDHTYVKQQPRMPTFHTTAAFAELRGFVLAELEYLNARNWGTLDWWSLNCADGEPKIFGTTFSQIRGRFLISPYDKMPERKVTPWLWYEFQKFDWPYAGIDCEQAITQYMDHLLDGFPSAGKEADLTVKNIFLRFWLNDLFDLVEKTRDTEMTPDLSSTERAEMLASYTRTLRALGKISRTLLPPAAAAYFNAVADASRSFRILENQLLNGGERDEDWKPKPKMIVVAAILSEGAAFNPDVPLELR